MQDQDAPPVEEGETGGGVVVVRVEAIPVAADPAATSSRAGFTAPPWITATERQWPAATTVLGPDASVPASRLTIPSLTLNPCLRARMRRHAFSALWMTCSFKLNVKVEFVKSESDLSERIKQNGEEKPSLIIFDLNSNSVKPLSLIPKLKSKLKKTSVIGFLSHVQGDLKQKAHEVGCDMVLPRSAFSQNLPQLLRRHGAADDETIQ
jgi:CheY-like chemotaxis protein